MPRLSLFKNDKVYDGETLGQVMQLAFNWQKRWNYDNDNEERAAIQLEELAKDTYRAWDRARYSRTEDELINRVRQAGELHGRMLRARLDYLELRAC